MYKTNELPCCYFIVVDLYFLFNKRVDGNASNDTKTAENTH